MTVSDILSVTCIGLAVVSAAASLLVHAYRRFKAIKSPKRWLAFEILMVLPVCLGLWIAVLGSRDEIASAIGFWLLLRAPIFWLVAVFGIRFIIEIFLPVAQWLADSIKSTSKRP